MSFFRYYINIQYDIWFIDYRLNRDKCKILNQNDVIKSICEPKEKACKPISTHHYSKRQKDTIFNKNRKPETRCNKQLFQPRK